jgi:hypothetical protein
MKKSGIHPKDEKYDFKFKWSNTQPKNGGGGGGGGGGGWGVVTSMVFFWNLSLYFASSKQLDFSSNVLAYYLLLFVDSILLLVKGDIHAF